MGLFWDLVQQSQISQADARAGSLETRIQVLEDELQRTQFLLHEVVTRLEKYVQQDLDDDGVVG